VAENERKACFFAWLCTSAKALSDALMMPSSDGVNLVKADSRALLTAGVMTILGEGTLPAKS
jgi:hypothetical protein